ncbi:MAG: NUDIX hydrolase [Rhizobiaceae bacterium]
MNQLTSNHLVERARRLFGDSPSKLQVAALPWRVGHRGVEVMLVSSRDTGRWVLPKGGVKKDEKLWRGAEREAEEEAGIRGKVSRREAGRYFYAKVQWIGQAVPCEVIVYPLEVMTMSDTWKEIGDRTRRWMSCVDAAASVEEPELTDLIRTFEGEAETYRADAAS